MSSNSTMGLREEIQNVIAQELNLEVASAESDLIATGVMDSLALVELILQLEQRYGVEITLDELDLEVFRTVATIALFIEQLRSDSAQLTTWAAQ